MRSARGTPRMVRRRCIRSCWTRSRSTRWRSRTPSSLRLPRPPGMSPMPSDTTRTPSSTWLFGLRPTTFSDEPPALGMVLGLVLPVPVQAITAGKPHRTPVRAVPGDARRVLSVQRLVLPSPPTRGPALEHPRVVVRQRRISLRSRLRTGFLHILSPGTGGLRSTVNSHAGRHRRSVLRHRAESSAGRMWNRRIMVNAPPGAQCASGADDLPAGIRFTDISGAGPARGRRHPADRDSRMPAANSRSSPPFI